MEYHIYKQHNQQTVYITKAQPEINHELIDQFAPLQKFIQANTQCNIYINYVTMFGKEKIGFMNVSAEGKGHAFLRGDSVAVLIVITRKEDQEKFVVLTSQERVPVGEKELIELPAGMMDGSKEFSSKAASEIKEECGMELKEDTLHELGYIYPSPGGCDEKIRLLLHECNMTKIEIEAMKGRTGGLKEEGESIVLVIMKLEDILYKCQDAKALSAYALFMQKLQSK